MPKEKTYIDGFDRILHGGFPLNSVTLVSGGSGTGKTILGAQFLIEGAKNNNKTGLFVTLDEKPDNIRQDFKSLGWKITELEEKEKFIILDAASPKVGVMSEEDYVARFGLDVDSLLNEITNLVEEKEVDRLVIDSLPMIAFRTKKGEIRTSIYRLMSLLNEIECTSLIITEREEGTKQISRFGVEQYAARGVILLEMHTVGNELRRTILVRKMRGTNHSKKRYPFEITNQGIEVYPYPDVYHQEVEPY
ncbi:MAG: KaiC family ATPase implicated in signal transduction [Candidatus Methanohalarchaeum thermophilum]|uniref:KaiC family ATPase implicated in signal transduction n=1 Tax=Methanohalarchaeum thermophilum TaxID=1903181 RepID=A0A1Q6DVU0_METT1|nr:MAG: KaiC family ATPase implicated in signal transduction [Candidatus Methanohalarchaeum thermophilum]